MSKKEERKAEFTYKIDQMDEAIQIIRDKPWKYYYEEEVSLDTKLTELKIIGKVFSVEEYEIFSEQLKNKMEVLTMDCISEDSEVKEITKDNLTDEVKALIKLRTIFESDLNEDEKEKKYNNLISKNNILLKYFNKDNINYYQQYTN
jgi:hypothetical protein